MSVLGGDLSPLILNRGFIPRKKGLKSLFDPLEHLTGHTYFSIPPMPLAKWSFYSVNVKCVNSIFDILYFVI